MFFYDVFDIKYEEKPPYFEGAFKDRDRLYRAYCIVLLYQGLV